MADIDPNLMAAMLQHDPQDPGPPGAQFLGGALKGMIWDPIKGAFTLAGNIADAAYRPDDPETEAMLTSTGQGLAQTALHPAQAVANAATDLYHHVTSGNPAEVGETLGSFVSPTRLMDAGTAARDIWAGRKSPVYSSEAAEIAKDMRDQGHTERSIYDATYDPSLGGGMWNPPPQWGQSDPWQWISDKEAALQPGTLKEFESEAQRQAESFHENVLRGRPVVMDPGDAPRELGRSERRDVLSDLTEKNDPGHWDARTLKSPQDLYTTPLMGARLSAPQNVTRTKYTLGELLEPDWKGFQAYPGLRDQPVYVTPWAPEYGQFVDAWGGAQAPHFQHGLKAGEMSVGGGMFAKSNKQWNAPNVVDTLLHEGGTHGVADFEGFPQGAGLGHALGFDKRITQALMSDTSLSEGDRAFLEARQHQVRMAGYDPRTGSLEPFQAYLNQAGEANARLPGEVIRAQKRQPNDRIYPWERYEYTGTTVSPGQMLVRGDPFGMVHPMYHPMTPPHLRDIISNQMITPIAGRDLSRGSTPPEQLALGLRRASQRKPKVPPQ